MAGRRKKSDTDFAIKKEGQDISQSDIKIKPDDHIFPEADKREMDRYFCVINNREGALLISEDITKQKDLGLFGVHQYASISKNSFACSFYFREFSNALRAIQYAKNLAG